MESFIKVDIFFFISSVATVILTILLAVLLFYLIRAGKNLYTLSETLKGKFQESEEFIAELKDRLEANMIFRLFFPPARKKWRAKVKKEPSKNEDK